MEIQQNLKIAVVGPGAVGCLLAHGLSKAGCRVTLLDYRRDRARRISSSGITIIMDNGTERSMPVCVSDAEAAGIHDVVIFTVKAYHTKNAVISAAPLVGQDTLVVTLQNGMGYEKYLRDITATGCLVTGITALGATLVQEGEVCLAGTGTTVMGFTHKPSRHSKRLIELLGEAFERAGWEFELVTDPEPARWKKLMANIGINAITAISCIRNGEILEYPDAKRIQEAAVREAFQVMQHHCVVPDDGIDAIMESVRDICRRTAGNISSMLQDRIRCGMTEIDYINGFVCRAGSKYGIKTPVNETLCRLVNLLSATGWRAAPDNACSRC